jgi:hypothetical protein
VRKRQWAARGSRGHAQWCTTTRAATAHTLRPHLPERPLPHKIDDIVFLQLRVVLKLHLYPAAAGSDLTPDAPALVTKG